MLALTNFTIRFLRPTMQPGPNEMSRSINKEGWFFRIAIFVLVLGACGVEKKATSTDNVSTTTSSEISSGTPTGTDLSSTCPERSQTDSCCCFEETQVMETGLDFVSSTRSVCGVHPLCPEMTFRCDGPEVGCPNGVLTTENEDAISCSLQAFADGDAGRISWLIENDMGSGGRNQVFFDLVGDGTVFRQRNDALDLCFDVFGVQRLPLPASSHYTDCLAEPDWQSKFACLRNVPFAEPDEICLEGHEFVGGC